ncbi:DUF4232 domain-containing protein [Kitasatospora camelliae]|uniref:DUF4232 domain-containing protein n=1 Tax=Kitasatospora camelliae TaxID=3156397 RepID=A0AAU8JQC8_9ACTN
MTVMGVVRVVSAGLALGGVVATLAGCGSERAVAVSGGPSAVASPSGDFRVKAETLSPTSYRQFGQLSSGKPSATGEVCPASGVQMSMDQGDAAMGLRVQGVLLRNCSTEPRTLEGYPAVQLLDEEGAPLDVAIDPGARQITSGIKDPGVHPVVVQPGGWARFMLVWRNTYDDTTHPPVSGAFAQVIPAGGAAAERVTPPAPFDLGSTGRLGVTAWDAYPAG